MLYLVDARAQRLDRISGEHRDRLGRDHGTRIHTRVDVVHGGSGLRGGRGEEVLERMGTWKVGKRRRVDVENAPRKPVEKRRLEQMHVAGTDDELRPVFFQPVRHRRVARIAAGVLLQREDSRGHSSRFRPLQRASARSIGRDRHDRKTGVEQRLEIRPLTRDQDPYHARTTVPITSASPGSGTTAT